MRKCGYSAACVIVLAVAALLCAEDRSPRDDNDTDVVHVEVKVRSSGDAALAALAALRGKNVISDKTMVIIEEHAQGWLVQVRELLEVPRNNPIDPAKCGRIVARVTVNGTGLRIENTEPRSRSGTVAEDDALAALTFLAATGRAPSGSWLMEIDSAPEGTRIQVTRLPLTPGAHASISVSKDRITVSPGR